MGKRKRELDKVLNQVKKMKEQLSGWEAVLSAKESSGDDSYNESDNQEEIGLGDIESHHSSNSDSESEQPENKENEQKANRQEDEKEDKESELDEECVLGLGDDPKSKEPKPLKLRTEVIKRWSHWSTNPFDNQEKEALLKKNPPPQGIIIPALNPEVASFLGEAAIKRDKHFVERQSLTAAALASLGLCLNQVMEAKSDENGFISIKKTDLIKQINDTGIIMSQELYGQTEARKFFILPGIEKNKRSILTGAKTDQFLFGANLKDRIKEAKSMQKMGQDIKVQQQVKPLKLKNWNGPQARRPTPAWSGQKAQSGKNKAKGLSKRQPFNPNVQNRPRFKPKQENQEKTE